MISAMHLAVFLIAAVLAAFPTYYLLRRTDEGRARGAISACLESTEAGFSLYSSLGFRRVDDYIIVGTEGPVTV